MEYFNALLACECPKGVSEDFRWFWFELHCSQVVIFAKLLRSEPSPVYDILEFKIFGLDSEKAVKDFISLNRSRFGSGVNW